MIHKKRLSVEIHYVNSIVLEDTFYILPILGLVIQKRYSRAILKFGWLIFKIGIFFNYV